MKIIVEKGVLGEIVKLVGTGFAQGEIEGKFKVVKMTAKEGEFTVESCGTDMDIRVETKNVVVEEAGEVQIDFVKFEQLVGQVNVSAKIISTASECKVVSGTAIWRLKIRDYVLNNEIKSDKGKGELVRTELLKDVLGRIKSIIPSERDATLDNVRMCMLMKGKIYATDRVRVAAIDFLPVLKKSIFLSRRMVDVLLRFISVTGEPDFHLVEDKGTYTFIFRQSVIKARKLIQKFPILQIEDLLSQKTVHWFNVRREDLIDGIKKAIVTSEYGEPKVTFKSIVEKEILELDSEDIVGNRGKVAIAANVLEENEATIRAELLYDLLIAAKGERLKISLVKGKFVKIDSDGAVSILMVMVANKAIKEKTKAEKGKNE